jgi:hypothetical protein
VLAPSGSARLAHPDQEHAVGGEVAERRLEHGDVSQHVFACVGRGLLGLAGEKHVQQRLEPSSLVVVFGLVRAVIELVGIVARSRSESKPSGSRAAIRSTEVSMMSQAPPRSSTQLAEYLRIGRRVDAQHLLATG